MLCKMLRVRYEQPRPAECKTLRHYTDPRLKFARGDLVRFACMEEQPLRARVLYSLTADLANNKHSVADLSDPLHCSHFHLHFQLARVAPLWQYSELAQNLFCTSIIHIVAHSCTLTVSIGASAD